MPSGAQRPSWPLVALLVGLIVWRVVTLGFDQTDLFMDEAQYWLWGQHLDWGYYSKPPMIAFLSRLVTDLAGSDAVFWVRLPAPLLHGVTALLTGLIATKLYDQHVGIWAALIYATTPFVVLGSWLFSTDTVLLPFFAAAILAFIHLNERPSLPWAIALGAATGLGALSKYAMFYFPVMAGLAALLLPGARISWRDAGVACLVALILLAPNILWNLQNGGTTIRHVAVENAHLGTAKLDIVRGLEFFLSQFGTFGPILFATLLFALWRSKAPDTRMLLLLSLPVIVFMFVQATRAHANANWAVTAYIAGSVLVAALLVRGAPRLLRVSFGLHLVVAILAPLLYMFPDLLRIPDGRHLMWRYLGQSDMSQDIAETAQANGLSTIVASDRAILADLFYTLRDAPLTVHAAPPRGGAVSNFYEQSFALGEVNGPALLVHMSERAPCNATLLREIDPDDGFFSRRTIRLSEVDAACLIARASR